MQLLENRPNALRKGIHSKIIYTSHKGAFFKKTDKEYLRESKFVSPKDLTIKFDFNVFDDKVILGIPYGKAGAIIIQNENIAASFKSLFDFIWKSIPEVPPQKNKN